MLPHTDFFILRRSIHHVAALSNTVSVVYVLLALVLTPAVQPGLTCSSLSTLRHPTGRATPPTPLT